MKVNFGFWKNLKLEVKQRDQTNIASESAKIENFKWDILRNFQTMWLLHINIFQLFDFVMAFKVIIEQLPDTIVHGRSGR